MSCEHRVLASGFFPLLLWWEKCRVDKKLAYCLFNIKIQEPKITLLYPLLTMHTEPWEFVFMHKNLHHKKPTCCVPLNKVGLVSLLEEKPSLYLRVYAWEGEAVIASWKHEGPHSPAQCSKKALPPSGCGYHCSHGRDSRQTVEWLELEGTLKVS